MPRSEFDKLAVPDNWREAPHLRLQHAALIAGVSPSALYAMAHQGRLQFVKLLGRTLVDTRSLIDLLGTREPWRPSTGTRPAQAAREARAASRSL